MTTLIERAADLLFPNDGRQTLNVKFFCAGEPGVTVNTLAEQIVRAEAQIKSGQARLMERFDA